MSGDNWRERCIEDVKRVFKKICVTELMDAFIAEGNRLFAPTKYASTWIIWHDALPAWFESEAQVPHDAVVVVKHETERESYWLLCLSVAGGSSCSVDFMCVTVCLSRLY
jgi:hypothetical protein